MRGMGVTIQGEDYVNFAEHKGLSPRVIFQDYYMRNAMLPQVSAFYASIPLHAELWQRLKTFALSPAAQEEELARWTEADKRRGFDAARLPLLRFTVHRRSDEDFQLSQSFHHAILDGWSDATMLVELFRDYFSLLAGEVAVLAAPSARMVDFVALERQALASPECRGYWDRLVTDSSFLELPRRPGAGVAVEPRVGSREIPLGPEASEGLVRFARSSAVAVKSVLLAAHLRVLAFLKGQPDVLTLMTSSGRPETSRTQLGTTVS